MADCGSAGTSLPKPPIRNIRSFLLIAITGTIAGATLLDNLTLRIACLAVLSVYLPGTAACTAFHQHLAGSAA
ncbi:MAG TPA: hypothetical protein VN367_07725 [Chlorobaculum sp.]|nr:hypothetical protein [Chlorobaculum sp.]